MKVLSQTTTIGKQGALHYNAIPEVRIPTPILVLGLLVTLSQVTWPLYASGLPLLNEDQRCVCL